MNFVKNSWNVGLKYETARSLSTRSVEFNSSLISFYFSTLVSPLLHSYASCVLFFSNNEIHENGFLEENIMNNMKNSSINYFLNIFACFST